MCTMLKGTQSSRPSLWHTLLDEHCEGACGGVFTPNPIMMGPSLLRVHGKIQILLGTRGEKTPSNWNSKYVAESSGNMDSSPSTDENP